MADTKVKLDSKHMSRYIKGMGVKLKNVHAQLKVGANTFGFSDIMKHFRDEQSSFGGWAPLKSRDGKPLQDTGTLRNSLMPSSGITKKVDSSSVLLFTNVKYAGKHNRGEGRIPQREFMWLSSNAQENILNLVMNWVVK